MKRIRFRRLELDSVEALARGDWPFEEPRLEGAMLPADFMREAMLPIACQMPKNFGHIAIVDGQVAGMGSFKGPVVEGEVEIGYGVAPSARGQGVATLLAQGLTHDALAMGAKCVVAHTNPENSASIRVLQKSAFLLEGPVSTLADGEVLRWTCA